MTALLAVALLKSALVALVGLATLGALWRWRPGPVDAFRLIVCGVVMGCAFPVIEVSSARLLGTHVFHSIAVLLYIGMIAFPLVGVAVLLAAWLQRVEVTRAGKALAGLAISFFFLGAWANLIEPHWLVLERAEVVLPPERAPATPISVGVIADLQTDHIGDYEHDAIDRLMALEPDVIVLPGDVYDSREPEAMISDVQELFSRLEAPGGVWLVEGDHDRREVLARMVEGTGVELLYNETRRVKVRGHEVAITGIQGRYDTDDASDAIASLTREGPSTIKLLVSHRPGVVKTMPGAGRVDLVLAGHTHGGQVNIPGFGPPLTLSVVERDVAAGGLHVVGGQTLYVSRGVGMLRGGAPALRFNCRPEISLLTLK